MPLLSDAQHPTAKDPDGFVVPDLEKQVRLKLVQLLYSQSTGGFVVNGLVAILLSFMLWDEVAHGTLLIWLALALGTVAARSLLALTFGNRDLHSTADMDRWKNLFLVGALTSGLLWGTLGTLLMPETSVLHQLFIFVALSGMAAGAVVFLSPVMTVYISYAVSTLGPPSLWLFSQGGSVHTATGLLGMVFIGGMVYAARQSHAALYSSLRLASEKDVLLNNLYLAKERLERRNEEYEAEIKTRRDAEQVLEVTLARVDGIVQNAPAVAIQGLDIDGTIRSWNPACEALYGYEEKEVLGRRVQSVLGQDDLNVESLEDTLKRIKESGRPIPPQEWQVNDKEGKTHWVYSSRFPVLDNGRAKEVICMDVDMSERRHVEQKLRKAKEQAEAANRAKSEFLANMSHEIRTPMNGVLGMLELLEKTPLVGEQNSYVHTARRSAQTLLALLGDILDLSKIEARQLKLEIVDFNLPTLVEDAAVVLARNAFGKRLNFACYVSPAIPAKLRGDPIRLRQVLTNLLSNAIKFTHEGTVSIRVGVTHAAKDSVDLRFEVQDTGIGIAPELHAELFRPFTQADGSITREYGGTGLGLTISEHLVSLMGGHIKVHSRPLQGSTFWFELSFPIDPDAVFDAPVPVEGLRVLQVAPDDVPRRFTGCYLEDWGVSHGQCNSLQAAIGELRLREADGPTYDIVLVNWRLIQGDDDPVWREFNRELTNVGARLVLVRNSADHDNIGDDYAVSAWIDEPIRRSELRTAIGMCEDAVESGDTSGDRPRFNVIAPGRGQLQGHVLLAEDDNVNRFLAATMLEHLGLQYTIVENGRQAVARAFDTDFDVVLMDCQMPEFDGLEATRRIREKEHQSRRERVPIIAVTASALLGDKERCIAVGMDDYLSKPFTLESLTRRLSRWLISGSVPEADRSD